MLKTEEERFFKNLLNSDLDLHLTMISTKAGDWPTLGTEINLFS